MIEQDIPDVVHYVTNERKTRPVLVYTEDLCLRRDLVASGVSEPPKALLKENVKSFTKSEWKQIKAFMADILKMSERAEDGLMKAYLLSAPLFRGLDFRNKETLAKMLLLQLSPFKNAREAVQACGRVRRFGDHGEIIR